MSYKAFDRAFEKFDRNQAKMAAAIGTSQQRISYIVLRENACPPDLVLPIERETGISRHDLRPDLYPVEERAA